MSRGKQISRGRLNTARRVAADIDKRLTPDVEVTVDAETEALYRSMPRDSLIILGHAFRLDRDTTAAPHTRAFCQSRLDLIEKVLRAKRR